MAPVSRTQVGEAIQAEYGDLTSLGQKKADPKNHPET
jgi:hypothetical protein